MAQKVSTGVLAALFAGAALLVVGVSASGEPEKEYDRIRKLLLLVYGPNGEGAYPRVIRPEEIILFYREYRIDQPGPLGSILLWTTHAQFHVKNSLSFLEDYVGERMVKVKVRPEWLEHEEIYGEDGLIEVLIQPGHVRAVIPGKVVEIGRGRLAELQFSNGVLLDIALTTTEARDLFPYAEHLSKRP